MRKVRVAACVVLGLGVLIGCSTFRDQSKAMVGGGAVAGKDYINGLKPSEKARAYFAQNASDGSKAVTISRTGDGANDTGVRFVANGGVVIPPGTSITFENQGYCCDPHLPAPKAGDEYQFVKTSQLIPEQLQPIYRKLLTKASNGDEATLRSMQKLVWALRTAGTEAGYANNLTDNEKRILNSCSEYEGEFELYCSEKLAMSRFWKKLLAKADSYTTINVGGVTYQASDLLDDKVCEKKIKAHLGQLITLGESMPVEHNGFNYGELENGIYTDIRGTGSLKFKATVANSSSQPFTFYPMDYIAQVGSGVSDESESVVYYATASTTQKQRVTILPNDKVEVTEKETEETEEDEKCKHVWVAESRRGENQEVSNDKLNEMVQRQELRKKHADQIAQKRSELTDGIKEMDRMPHLEYGSIIYYQNGLIKAQDIMAGNPDYELGPRGSPIARTTKRVDPSDGVEKYFLYKGMTGDVDYSIAYDTPYAHYDKAVEMTESGSFPIGKALASLPPGAVPLEYVHLHPNKTNGIFSENESNILSYEDMAVAYNQSLNATVIIPPNRTSYNSDLLPGWRWLKREWLEITFDPTTREFSRSDGQSSKKLESDHRPSLDRLNKTYRIYCKKCGATR